MNPIQPNNGMIVVGENFFSSTACKTATFALCTILAIASLFLFNPPGSYLLAALFITCGLYAIDALNGLDCLSSINFIAYIPISTDRVDHYHTASVAPGSFHRIEHHQIGGGEEPQRPRGRHRFGSG